MIEDSMDVCFKYKMTSAGKDCHLSLKVVGGSHVNADENCCFCGTFG